MKTRSLLFLLLSGMTLLPACSKTPAGVATPRTVQVELSRGKSAPNAAGDNAYLYTEVSTVGYVTDAGDNGVMTMSDKGPLSMTGNAEVKSTATRLWCYIPTKEVGYSVPARLSKNDAGSSAAFEGMVFCTDPIALTQKETCSGDLKSVTSAIGLDIFASKEEWTGAAFSTVTLEASSDRTLAGNFALNVKEARIGEVRNASSTLTFDCNGFNVGAATSPVSLGAVVLPGDFTGTITVSGEKFNACFSFTQPLSLQAGYVKHIPLDISKATVESEAPKTFPKRLGILGDSISTYEGKILTGHRTYYPAGDVNDWKKTYWGILVGEYWHCDDFVNSSWSGSSVASGKAGSVRTPFVDHSRLDALPDSGVILLFGGTNDAISTNEIGLGEFCYDTPLDQINHYRRFRDAYIYVIRYLQGKGPDRQVICIIGTDITGEYGNSVEAIAKHYNLPYVDFRGEKNVAGKVSIYSGSHPDAAGHAYMARKIYEETLNLFQ
jgi:hypothetical protein